MRKKARGRRARTLGFVALAAVAGAAPARASDGPLIRVLLEDGVDRLDLGAADGLSHRLSIVAGELALDGLPIASPLRRSAGPVLHVADWSVRGDVIVSRTERGLRLVNELPIETYLAGTVAAETPVTFGDEVLRAQAVAARTYALHQRALAPDAPFHLRATTASQRYRGVDAESDAARNAVDATRGETLWYGGQPILAVFHSSSGGRTESADEVWSESIPYLQALDVSGEEISPDTYWRARVSGESLGRALRDGRFAGAGDVGRALAVEIVERSPTGRARRVRVEGTRGSVELTASALRSAVGETVLRSTLFEVRRADDGFVFVGSGRGHGVGMSQWGALAMARDGAHYRDILTRFYPGTTLEPLRNSEP